MLLYCFITHQKHLAQTHKRVLKIMTDLGLSNFIVVAGGYDVQRYAPSQNLLQLKCNDRYEGLPDKIFQMFSYLFQHPKSFGSYTHFLKCDEDTIIKRPIKPSTLKKVDYGGVINWTAEIDRNWHIGKCSRDSPFYNTPYTGSTIPYCLGGFGYIISQKACQFIAQSKVDTSTEIYEDLLIAKLLYKAHIRPVDLVLRMHKVIKSPDHSYSLYDLRSYYLAKIKFFLNHLKNIRLLS